MILLSEKKVFKINDIKNPEKSPELYYEFKKFIKDFNEKIENKNKEIIKKFLKEFVKFVLNIYKNCEVFDNNKEYKKESKYTDDKKLFKNFNLNYVKNESCTEIGVIKDDINKKEFKNFNEAVLAGKIEKVELIDFNKNEKITLSF